MNILENKINGANKLHKELNRIVPLILAELNNGYKINTGGELDKRTIDRIAPILESARKKRIRLYIDSGYSVFTLLFADITFQTSECTCDYYKTYTDLLVDSKKEVAQFTPYKLFSYKKALTSLAKIKDLENKISSINTQITELNRNIPRVR